MLESFRQYITEKRLFSPSHRLLLAVSGGMDSVVMCDLFSKAKFSFAIAHCNFQLRGEESEEDAKFVKNLSVKYHVPFFMKHFDTKSYAEKKKISTQMAARDLRYKWFEEVLKKEKYDFLVTAHHKNDVTETIILNLTKGTGIHGLHGIKPINGNVIRPLLFATREQIKNYTEIEKLAWREDSSNSSVKYQRNLIRHEMIPILKKINPSLEETMEQTIEKLSAVENIFNLKVEEVKEAALKYEKGYTTIDIEIIKNEAEPGIILFELLRSYGFNYSDTINLLNTSEIGKKIKSETHTVVYDRKHFVITENTATDFGKYYIEITDKELLTDNLSLAFSIEENENFKIPTDSNTACLDFRKLEFPLTIRSWEDGDYFYPLGMRQKKKISDFLIDKKIPLNLKDKIRILVSNEKIAWVIGLRVDDRFKISEETKKIFIVKSKNG